MYLNLSPVSVALWGAFQHTLPENYFKRIHLQYNCCSCQKSQTPLVHFKCDCRQTIMKNTPADEIFNESFGNFNSFYLANMYIYLQLLARRHIITCQTIKLCNSVLRSFSNVAKSYKKSSAGIFFNTVCIHACVYALGW